jgi:hypothetical protein
VGRKGVEVRSSYPPNEATTDLKFVDIIAESSEVAIRRSFTLVRGPLPCRDPGSCPTPRRRIAFVNA